MTFDATAAENLNTHRITVPLVLSTPDWGPPQRAHTTDAGYDLVSTIATVLPPHGRATIPTGVHIALPPGHAAFVMPRSGLAAKHGITCLNAPGVVDSGYRGEIRVTIHNTDALEAFSVSPGDRIAQLVIQRVCDVEFVAATDLPESDRGALGHGSTGGFGVES
ncbi:dUTP diphosphatase [Micrococcales bacterium 31B]|nr:dUTP diphosphatase [Micrococcales bacterium 31B]